MEVGQPRKKRIDILREKLDAGSGTFADVQSIATSVNLMKGRYMARPAAELLVERGDPMASEIAKGLAMTPVLGRDPGGDLLRAAFKQALAKEGIPADIDEMARPRRSTPLVGTSPAPAQAAAGSWARFAASLAAAARGLTLGSEGIDLGRGRSAGAQTCQAPDRAHDTLDPQVR